MKPGELERNLSRLAEVARAARERLATMERELTELRHGLEGLSGAVPKSRTPAEPAPAESPAAPEPGEQPDAENGRSRESRSRGEQAAAPLAGGRMEVVFK